MRLLIPIFAKVKLCIYNVSRKLQRKMAKLVMEDKLKDKRNSKKKLRNVIGRLAIDLKRKVSLI